jgi:hypothetical protein
MKAQQILVWVERSWYEKIDTALLKLDFTRLATNNCIYIKQPLDHD